MWMHPSTIEKVDWIYKLNIPSKLNIRVFSFSRNTQDIMNQIGKISSFRLVLLDVSDKKDGSS